jgi:proliferating cell nuclear antigen
MLLIIENKFKLEIFVSIFQLLKNWSSHISLHFEKDKLYIQTMDKSHICLADIVITNSWFTFFECLNQTKISVDSNHFSILMNYALKHNKLELRYEDENVVDKLYINFLHEKEKNGSFDHFFELNLMDIDEETLVIPKVDYDVDFVVESKKLSELLSELNNFGEDFNIKCSETTVELNTTGDLTKLKINILVEDLEEYSISEGVDIDVSYSLSHLCKMCLSAKINSTVNISISKELPMSLVYNLGEDSRVSFFIAPKISE